MRACLPTAIASFFVFGCAERSDSVLDVASAGAPVRTACEIATVAGSRITDADARAIVGLLRPPPPTAEARRLAVAAAIAACAVDCRQVTSSPRVHSTWLEHYKKSEFGAYRSGRRSEPGDRDTRANELVVEWATGDAACPTGRSAYSTDRNG